MPSEFPDGLAALSVWVTQAQEVLAVSHQSTHWIGIRTVLTSRYHRAGLHLHCDGVSREMGCWTAAGTSSTLDGEPSVVQFHQLECNSVRFVRQKADNWALPLNAVNRSL